MRLLIIEDEHTLQSQLCTQMRKAGFAVDAASDGKEGLFMGREYPFDLAIVDIGLPHLSGIEVIKTWRELGKNFRCLF